MKTTPSQKVTSKERNVGQNLAYINKHPVRITIESRHLPGGAEHNLICWMCNINHAIYSMHPQWCFLPCRKCQSKYEGIWTKKTWWQKWLDERREKMYLEKLIKELK